MKDDEIFVKELIDLLVGKELDAYEDTILEEISKEEYELIKKYVKFSTVNTISTILGIIDGISILNKIGNKKITLLIDNKEVQGDLYEIFNENMEEYNKELLKNGI